MFIKYKLLFFFILCTLLIGTSQSINAQLFPTTNNQEQYDSIAEQPIDPLGRSTPRGTLNGFISAVADRDYFTASQYLNLEQTPGEQEAERLAQVLQRLLDQGGNILPYTLISDESSGRTDDNLDPEVDKIGTVTADGERIDLFLEKAEGPEDSSIWLFSSETIEVLATVTGEDVLLVERILPGFLKDNLWGGVSVGQWLIILILAAFAYLLSWCIFEIILYLIRVFWKKARTQPASGILNALALPIRISLAVWLFSMLSENIGISIILRQKFSGLTLIIGLVAFLILLWSLTEFISDFSERKLSHRGSASGVSVILFLRRAAKVAVVIFGIIAILGVLGVNVTTGLAALGIGGIALALGAQKTVENFVGSVTLIADQPVRVGDFCKVGDTVGTVEQIGMRSTRIRTLNRTVVTIPNGQFSSETIENYAHRDRFWFQTVLDLRYETTPDQIRFLLVELRSVLYAHPKVHPEPARVRFTGLGAASLNLEVFCYITAVNFDEFLEVREDLLLRIMDVVAESGTDFAFPSQTLYFAKDKGLSKEKSQQAEEKVRKWKEAHDMPIPSFENERIEKLKNTISYPPEGSTKTGGQEEKLF